MKAPKRPESIPLGKLAKTWLSALVLIGTLAVAGSAAAAQGTRFDALFNATDTDGNGLISEAEWHSAMQKRMEAIDADHDNNLTREEFQQAKETLRERFRGRAFRTQN